MFEEKTQHIIATIRQRTIGAETNITVKDILAGDIPHVMKTFFRVDVEALFLSELQSYRKTSHFGFNHPEVQSLQQQITSLVVQEYSFEREEYLRRLSDAVHLMMNYLLRPQWTLENVVFESDQTMPSSTLLGMLRYFGPYEYFREAIRQYLQEKHVEQFTREEFSRLLRKIDGEFILRKAGDELSRIMSPIYDFLDFPERTGKYALPIKGAIKYFEDKGLTTIVSELEEEEARGRQAVTGTELGELLEAVRRVHGAFETSETVPDGAAPTTPAQDPAGVTNRKPQPTILELVIGEEDSRKIVKKIFRQDEEAFRQALQALDGIRTWRQASKFIDELFIENDVDPYCSEAERFVEILFRQYHAKTY